MLQVENERQTLLLVIFRTDVLLLIQTIRTRAFASVVDPAHQIIVVGLLSFAGKVGGKLSALHLLTLADGMTSKTAARLKELFAPHGIAHLVFRELVLESRLPQIGRNSLDLVVVETEVRHLGGGSEIALLLQPYWNPVLVQLQTNVFQIGADLLHVLEQALTAAVELHDAQVQFAIGDS